MSVLSGKKFEFSRKVLAIHQLRVNVKSLAAEAKIIRQEARRCGPIYRDALNGHRRGRLREEARHAQLALAYVRGLAYRDVEAKVGEGHQVSASKLCDKLKRACIVASPGDVVAWLR